MKNGKAPGFDGIVTKHIKIAQDILLTHLVKLFNANVDAESYPQQFKRGVNINTLQRRQ